MLPADLKGRVANLDEFFASGRAQIDSLMKRLESLGLTVNRRRALDFGCGLGRTSQALAAYFDEVYGLDIAPPIIELARKYNKVGAKCKYLINETSELAVIGDNTIDLVWSYGVLHVMEPRYFENYIREFLRILAPGGVAVFQQTSSPGVGLKGALFHVIPVRLLNLYRRARYGFEAYWVKREAVIALVQGLGGVVLDTVEDRKNPGPDWIGYQYVVLKPS